MKALSLFSGVGGFELGFGRAGITTGMQVEQDRWCQEVLARHWPDTRRETQVEDVQGTIDWDLIYGGFPCQDLSVAGARKGLGGDRSGLWWEFARLLGECRPPWVVIEQVPGLFSAARGRDFARLLHALDDLGYGVAWSVLDAQHFGVPQRRRRVFIVGHLGDWRGPVEVLALPTSGPGDPASRQETTANVAGSLGQGPGSGGRSTTDLDGHGAYIPLAATLTGGGHPNSNAPGRHREDDTKLVSNALTATGIGVAGPDDNQAQAGHLVANTLGARPKGGRSLTGETYVTYPGIPASLGTLTTTFGAKNYSNLQEVQQGSVVAWESQPAQAGTSGTGDAATLVGVRRLTPRECERLMGWPDDHTRWTAEGTAIADTHRYRMCGNGVVAPVAEWLGRRLMATVQA